MQRTVGKASLRDLLRTQVSEGCRYKLGFPLPRLPSFSSKCLEAEDVNVGVICFVKSGCSTSEL